MSGAKVRGLGTERILGRSEEERRKPPWARWRENHVGWLGGRTPRTVWIEKVTQMKNKQVLMEF